MKTLLLLLLLVLGLAPATRAQQITVPRVEQMPALPATYLMRDWKRVAQGYDSLVFNPVAQGTHLPLVQLYDNGPNYPQYGGFGLHSYVGTRAPEGGEAINGLPALVGATLVGVNKRSHYGIDWVLRAQQNFNRRPGENVYLNSPAATSGSDWWYDTMPNVFFYQLYSLYGSVGDFDAQFVSVADRWLAALDTLGGNTRPWQRPFMNYRAFSLSTMQPLRTGVPEPEAAGALAWLQYMAYVRTGEDRYRVGAEWALEFLNGWQSNPSYELQLPYGALAAVRMNAELGTRYDVEKLVNWTFEMGALRGWGTTVGSWGGYDASGLVGEIQYSDYAFVLNGFQQAAALVPLVRYDDRFARAIGRWMVNLASASRLFYSPYLPSANQDGEAWAQANDPHGFIAYEALREREGSISPYATGDAVRGGWAATNLSLYSSSSVGYLAALIDTTEVRGLLRLDLRATDFFAPDAYATYLYYNPYPTAQTVALVLPAGTHDLYDTVADTYLQRSAAGTAMIEIPADGARVVVLVPSGQEEVSSDGKLTVGGVVVDYRVGSPAPRPRVKGFFADREKLARDQATRLYCTGEGIGTLTYTWAASGGTLGTSGALGASRVINWSSSEPGSYEIVCSIEDGSGVVVRDTLQLSVASNFPPAVADVIATPDIVDLSGSARLTCMATDPEGDPLTYSWVAEAGTLEENGSSADWTAPDSVGYFGIACFARDPSEAVGSATGFVTVGRLVAHFPLEGDARDASGFEIDGRVLGPVAAADRQGTPGGALYFDGVDDHVAVDEHGALAFSEQVTVAAWLQPEAALDREQFVVSHGSWQNRWKLSITPDQKLRWTINTGAGIVDLDAPMTVQPGAFVFVVATYDGAVMRLFLDGVPVSSRAHTGRFSPAPFPLLLGQMLPGQAEYNFKGVLDEVRIYNTALAAADVQALYATYTPVETEPIHPGNTWLGVPQPNPSAGPVRIPFTLAEAGSARLVLYDLIGRQVNVLWNSQTAAGTHVAEWDGRAGDGVQVGAGLYLMVLETGSKRLRQALVRVP